MRHLVVLFIHFLATLVPYSEKTRPGRCPEPEIIALRALMINRAGSAFARDIPGILNVCADRESIARCPVHFYAASLS